ncbi:hypothetical protein KEM54_003637 [Ascosphaera aggregata]|nr:hypothetical protein KEM54_003637 [Ascosphaera aggregata]
MSISNVNYRSRPLSNSVEELRIPCLETDGTVKEIEGMLTELYVNQVTDLVKDEQSFTFNLGLQTNAAQSNPGDDKGRRTANT